MLIFLFVEGSGPPCNIDLTKVILFNFLQSAFELHVGSGGVILVHAPLICSYYTTRDVNVPINCDVVCVGSVIST